MDRRNELISGTLLLLTVAALLLGTYAVLRPFLPSIVWAAIVVVATWPLMLRVQAFFGGRRKLAVAVMSSSLFLVVLAPVTLLLGTLVSRFAELRELGTRVLAGPWPGPPAWLARLPYGPTLSAQWQHLASQSSADWAEFFKPYVGKIALWFSQHIGTLGGLTLEFLLTLVLVVVFYIHGEAMARLVKRVARRMGAARGEESVQLAVQAARAVAAGVVLTALGQALLSGFGLWVVGAPAVGILTSLMFMLCVMQIGPLPVLIPAILWLWFSGAIGWGVALAVWAVAMSVGDNLLRPWLIQRGARLPFILILGGVIGGLLAFGVAGIFIGPILLAVVKRLLERWVAEHA
jgi:predicted PurR-regulated permease PerM